MLLLLSLAGNPGINSYSHFSVNSLRRGIKVSLSVQCINTDVRPACWETATRVERVDSAEDLSHCLAWLYFGAHRDEELINLMQSLLDRKSTRLNSSHITISYAVF